MYLRNCWYVAARGPEIGRAIVAARVLGENVALFRREDGAPVALEDACPHRKLPLSMGRLVGDHVVCGYHGLTFDGEGRCVASPTQARIPSTARVRSYPVVERWGMIWIWMGAAELADEGKIPHIDNSDDSRWGLTHGGKMSCACNYLWLADNLLDPSHVAWVHVTSFAAKGTQDAPLTVKASDDGVVVSRWMRDVEPPPFYAPLVKFKGNCDRLQHYEVRYPAVAINKSIFTPAGTGGNENDLPDDAYRMVSYHFLTPIDENHTLYNWLQNRNTDPKDEGISAAIAAGAAGAFEEDRLILEAVHAGMANAASPHLDLALDAGSLRFRRGLRALIERENAPAIVPAGA